MTILDYLGIECLTKNQEEVVLQMTVTQNHLQPFKLMHGGLNAMLIETACSIGANEYLDNKIKVAIGLDVQANHIKSVASGVITTIAKPNHIGGTTQVWEASIFNDKNELISVGRCSLMNKKINY
ncbi:PaaI family thioesterase [Vagococcus jeotgali]|uniref:PaaI family thioesterase n=1 Tax=Vagococcus jeotgali TaxID=3109030 RepID=UPI002DDB6A59|nr:PaaI family thioesterase [Vagococcus sp. B2T-5]